MPSTAFGISRYVEEPRRQQLRQFLRIAWRNQFGSEPQDVPGDLELLRTWFRPELSGKSARSQLLEITKLPHEIPPELKVEGIIRLPGRRGLVTPEGRMILALLEGESEGISDDDLLQAAVDLTEFYAGAYRKRLTHVLSGEDARPNTLAFVVLLLINGSVGENRKFEIPSDPDQETRLATAVFQVQDAFVAGIGGAPLADPQRERLRSNWVLTQAEPQFPFLVAHEGDAYWLREEEQGVMPEELGRVLASRRSPPPVASLEETLERTLGVYTASRPVFSGLSLSHYRPNRVKAEFRRVISAFSNHLHQ
jgi:hypothetical protein